MNSKSATLVLCAAMVCVTSAFAQGASGPAPGGDSQKMHESIMSGMQKMQGMKLSGDMDKDFATMMRMHHQRAIDMSKAELEHGKNAEMKQLAEKIINDQQKEIAQIDRWLAGYK